MEEEIIATFEPDDAIAQRIEAAAHLIDCIAKLAPKQTELRDAGLKFLEAAQMTLAPREKASVTQIAGGRAL